MQEVSSVIADSLGVLLSPAPQGSSEAGSWASAAASSPSAGQPPSPANRPQQPAQGRMLLSPGTQCRLLLLLARSCCCVELMRPGLAAVLRVLVMAETVLGAAGWHAGSCRGLAAAQLLLACGRCLTLALRASKQAGSADRFDVTAQALRVIARAATISQLMPGECPESIPFMAAAFQY